MGFIQFSPSSPSDRFSFREILFIREQKAQWVFTGIKRALSGEKRFSASKPQEKKNKRGPEAQCEKQIHKDLIIHRSANGKAEAMQTASRHKTASAFPVSSVRNS